MNKVIIFGINNLASLAHFYLQKDSPYEVVAFTEFREYLPESDVKACSCIVSNTEPWSIYQGVPAKKQACSNETQ